MIFNQALQLAKVDGIITDTLRNIRLQPPHEPEEGRNAEHGRDDVIYDLQRLRVPSEGRCDGYEQVPR